MFHNLVILITFLTLVIHINSDVIINNILSYNHENSYVKINLTFDKYYSEIKNKIAHMKDVYKLSNDIIYIGTIKNGILWNGYIDFGNGYYQDCRNGIIYTLYSFGLNKVKLYFFDSPKVKPRIFNNFDF